MDAAAILESVARTYANLKTLSIQILAVTETSNEGSSSRNELATKAWFEAPGKVRIEQGGGPHGTVIVTDGTDVHSFLALPNRYSKHPANSRGFLPGQFLPERASLFARPPAFLFANIYRQVKSAEILSESSVTILVSATYEEPAHPVLRLHAPVLFSIDTQTLLVSRVEGEVSMRMPAQDHTVVSKHALSFVNPIVNEPIPPDIFTFVPPATSVNASQSHGRGGISFGGGGGGSLRRPGGKDHFESRHSHEWAGDTLIERYALRAHGVDLMFERSLTFSEDRRELQVSERIISPGGEASRDLSLPLA